MKNTVTVKIAIAVTFLNDSRDRVCFIIGIRTPIPSKKNKLTPMVLGIPFGIINDVSLLEPCSACYWTTTAINIVVTYKIIRLPKA